MGVYLYSSASDAYVKVSGLLADVVPTADEPSGSMEAEEFLARLDEVADSFYKSSSWSDLVALGRKAALDAHASEAPVSCVGDSSEWGLWFTDRRISAARALAKEAAEGNVNVSWS